MKDKHCLSTIWGPNLVCACVLLIHSCFLIRPTYKKIKRFQTHITKKNNPISNFFGEIRYLTAPGPFRGDFWRHLPRLQFSPFLTLSDPSSFPAFPTQEAFASAIPALE